MQSNWQAMQSFWEGFDYQLLVCFFGETTNAFIGMRFARTGPITIPDPNFRVIKASSFTAALTGPSE